MRSSRRSGFLGPLEKTTSRRFQLGKVLIDCGGEDGVRSIEVTAGEPVAHTGDLRPWQRSFGGEELVWEGLDRFADLDEPHPYCVEDESIAEITPLEMGTNRLYGDHDVFKAPTVPTAHRATASART